MIKKNSLFKEDDRQYSIPKIKLSQISKTRLDLDCSRPVFNNHKICKNFTEQEQNPHIISWMWFRPLVLCSSCVC